MQLRFKNIILQGPFYIEKKNIKKLGVIIFLFIILQFLSINVILSKHKSRNLHTKSQALQQEKNSLYLERNNLLLEKSALLSEVNIEKIAREKLGLIKPDKIEIIKPCK